MDDEKMNYLLDKGVMVCTSLDGPADLHDYNRGWTGKTSSYASVTGWMDKFNAEWVRRGFRPGPVPRGCADDHDPRLAHPRQGDRG